MTTATQQTITTRNPANGERLDAYPVHDRGAIDVALDRAVSAAAVWRVRPVRERAALVANLARELRTRKTELAALATREMGKTIGEAEAEVEKCAIGCEYYATHGAPHIADETVASTASESYVAYRPLGVLLAIMPWNFPYWQAFRAMAPALTAGNVVVLKHASNVTGCALAIETLARAAGFDEGIFTTLVVGGSEMDAIVADRRIAAVTLTGSEGAGSAVAATAGKHLKKTVLELGGSDAFIVLADADLDAAAKMAVKARFQNCGQSCIAAKRFIVEASVHDAFLNAFARETQSVKAGDPFDRSSTIGPLARVDLRDALEAQIEGSIARGARVVTGGKRIAGKGSYFEPTIVADVVRGMPMFDEETFGPAAAVVRARDLDDCVELANASQYGLGGNLWTQDIERAKVIAARLESGGVFINGMTASDPRLPFGGVKQSGYGRELSWFGIQEFVNIQTVWIGPQRDEASRATTAAE